jgi:hypothetical protein
MATRPRWRARSELLDRKAMTPPAIISGETQPSGKDNTCAVSVVPTLAPSITARPIEREISPRPAKEASSRAVAVLD